MKRIFLFIILGIFIPSVSFAYTAYVHSSHADVYTKPSMSAQKSSQLVKGDKVNVIQKTGTWCEIEHTAGKGYVYAFLLKKEEVKTKDRLYSRLRSFFSKIESVSSKSRRRPSSYTATAAARGLRDKRKHFATLYESDYDTLEKFEGIKISEDEAYDFIRKGVTNEKNH